MCDPGVGMSDRLIRRSFIAIKRLQEKKVKEARDILADLSSIAVHTRPVERVRDLFGRFETGKPDLGQRHREYLLLRFRALRKSKPE